MLQLILIISTLLLAETPTPNAPSTPLAPNPKISKEKAAPRWTVSPHRILKVEHSRISGGKLERWLFQGPMDQQKRVLLAMARIGDPAFIESVNGLLNSSRNTQLREAAAFTLGSIEGETSYVFITQNIPMHKDPKVVGALLIAAGRTGNPRAIHFLTQYLKPGVSRLLRASASRGLGHAFTRLGDKAPEDDSTLSVLADLLTDPETVLPAAFALARWQGNPAKLPLATLLFNAPAVVTGQARALVFRVLGKIRSPAARDLLCNAALKTGALEERIEALKALGNQQPNDCVFAALRSGLANNYRHVQAATLEATQRLSQAAALIVGDVDGLLAGSGSEWIRSLALSTLARIDPPLARKRIGELLPKSSGMVLESIIGAFAVLGTPADLAATLEFLNSPHPRLTFRAMESLVLINSVQLTPEIQQALRTAIAKADGAVVAAAVDAIEKHRLSNHLPALIEIYPRFSNDDAAEIRAAIVRAVGELGDMSHTVFLEFAMKDAHRIVAESAARGLKRITGKNYSFPLNSSASAKLPAAYQLAGSVARTVHIQTSRGDFSFRLFDHTPITDFYFLKEAKNQVGRTFHRVVPNFVVQGGDPRGDGFGGPGYSIRDEISIQEHERGIIGIATSGKDTGGCQFFVNTAANLHLMGRYTSFARITSGIEVVDRLEPTDTILRVRTQ